MAFDANRRGSRQRRGLVARVRNVQGAAHITSHLRTAASTAVDRDFIVHVSALGRLR